MAKLRDDQDERNHGEADHEDRVEPLAAAGAKVGSEDGPNLENPAVARSFVLVGDHRPRADSALVGAAWSLRQN